jgi:hypothetical protein
MKSRSRAQVVGHEHAPSAVHKTAFNSSTGRVEWTTCDNCGRSIRDDETVTAYEGRYDFCSERCLDLYFPTNRRARGAY